MSDLERLKAWKAVLEEVALRYRPQRSIGNVIQNIKQEIEAYEADEHQ